MSIPQEDPAADKTPAEIGLAQDGLFKTLLGHIELWAKRTSPTRCREFVKGVTVKSARLLPFYYVSYSFVLETRTVDEVVSPGKNGKDGTSGKIILPWKFAFKDIASDKKDYQQKAVIKSAIYSSVCPTCHGTLKSSCSKCRKGMEKCSECSGRGQVKCTKCDGSGKSEQYATEEIACPICYGRGENPLGKRVFGEGFCTNCLGYGSVFKKHSAGIADCTACDATGWIKCSKCSGTGERECPYCMGYGSQNCATCAQTGYITISPLVVRNIKHIDKNAWVKNPRIALASKDMGILVHEMDRRKMTSGKEVARGTPDEVIQSYTSHPSVKEQVLSLTREGDSGEGKVNHAELIIKRHDVIEVEYLHGAREYKIYLLGGSGKHFIVAFDSPLLADAREATRKAEAALDKNCTRQGLALLKKAIIEDVSRDKEALTLLDHTEIRMGYALYQLAEQHVKNKNIKEAVICLRAASWCSPERKEVREKISKYAESEKSGIIGGFGCSGVILCGLVIVGAETKEGLLLALTFIVYGIVIGFLSISRHNKIKGTTNDIPSCVPSNGNMNKRIQILEHVIERIPNVLFNYSSIKISDVPWNKNP